MTSPVSFTSGSFQRTTDPNEPRSALFMLLVVIFAGQFNTVDGLVSSGKLTDVVGNNEIAKEVVKMRIS